MCYVVCTFVLILDIHCTFSPPTKPWQRLQGRRVCTPFIASRLEPPWSSVKGRLCRRTQPRQATRSTHTAACSRACRDVWYPCTRVSRPRCVVFTLNTCGQTSPVRQPFQQKKKKHASCIRFEYYDAELQTLIKSIKYIILCRGYTEIDMPSRILMKPRYPCDVTNGLVADQHSRSAVTASGKWSGLAQLASQFDFGIAVSYGTRFHFFCFE